MNEDGFCPTGTEVDETLRCPGTDESSCTQEICCVATLKCSSAGAALCGPEYKFMENNSCNGINPVSCTMNDCCELYATCHSFDESQCNETQVKMPLQKCDDIIDDSCSPDECCSSLPTGATPSCSDTFSGSCPLHTVLSADVTCPRTCTQSLCCEPMERCASRMNEDDFCLDGTEIDSTLRCPGTDESSCTQDACCVQIKNCSSASASLCPLGFQFMENNSCQGISPGACTQHECCEALATCHSFDASQCNDTQVKMHLHECEGIGDDSCTQDACCAPRAFCAASLVCPEPNEFANTSIMCAGTTCSEDECCFESLAG